LRVIDTGPGIAEERRADVFVPFQRLGDTDNTSGVGLGLALSRGFVEAMGGTIEVEDTPRRRPHDGDRTGGGMKIVIADDDPQMLRALRVTLAARGHDVVTAADGQAALDAVISAHPDIVVLDLGMPGVTGIEVIQALRGWTQVPVLVVSGRSDTQDKVDALDAGADDYVTKPFSADELLARIRALSRRTAPASEDQPIVRFGDVIVDLPAPVVTRAGEPIRLTPTEWRMLDVLIRNRDKLVTRDAMLPWGLGVPRA
jgi:two-component system KDP operon response regulator KdpE